MLEKSAKVLFRQDICKAQKWEDHIHSLLAMNEGHSRTNMLI